MMRTISTRRSGRDDSTAAALFHAFGVGPDLSSQKGRRVCDCKKLVHIMVMTLKLGVFQESFFYATAPPGRRPSELHRKVSERVEMFLKACGPPEQISASGCGRKKFQLDARLRELEGALGALRSIRRQCTIVELLATMYLLTMRPVMSSGPTDP